jgi:hypothetical protein
MLTLLGDLKDILIYQSQSQYTPRYKNKRHFTDNIHTYIPLKLYTRRGSRGILDIPPRRPRFTKIT